MADIFISYAREDRDTARAVARTLEVDAYSVWWDRQLLGGENFDEAIERELDLANCVIVLWSKHSVSSDWVRNEAAAAAERGVLVPAYIDAVKLPLQFRRKHTIDLASWRGDANDPEFDSMRRAIGAHLGRELPLRTPGRLAVAPLSRRLGLVVAVCVVVGLAAWMSTYLIRSARTKRASSPLKTEELHPTSTVSASNTAIAQSPPEEAALKEPKPIGRYSVDQCGSIKDVRSGLEWYVGAERTVSWHEARNWIDGLQVCAGGWRMPTISELKTLYDPTKTAGIGYLAGGKRWPSHIDPVFDIGESSWAWAAGVPKNGMAKSFNFNQGIEAAYSPTGTDYTTRAFAVRRVR